MTGVEEMLTSTQVAKALQLNVRTVTNLLNKGYIRGIKIRRVWRIKPSELEAFQKCGVNYL